MSTPDNDQFNAAVATIQSLWAARSGQPAVTAPTVRMYSVGRKIANTVLVHWKSSLAGLLQAGLAVVIAVAALPPTASKVVYIIAGGRALLGFIQKDPDVVIAKVPGVAEPQAVAAHSVPDNPQSVALESLAGPTPTPKSVALDG